MGAAIAVKKGVTSAADAAAAIGIGLQALHPRHLWQTTEGGSGVATWALMLPGTRPRASPSWSVTSSFAAAEGPSASPATPSASAFRTLPAGHPERLKQVTPRSSPVSTASPTYRPSRTTTPASPRGQGDPHLRRARRRRATAQTMCGKAWPSCTTRAWT